MNLLQRQGFFNSIILYLGVGLGFFNLIVLFQRLLTIEEIGFFSLIVAISTLYVQVASLGLNNIILRYFPYYRSEDKTHSGFITFISLFSITSFIIFTTIFILFKTPIAQYYQHKSGASLLIKYYYYIIPLSFFTLLFGILEGLARTLYKNILSTFLREVLLRIFTSLAVLLIFFKWADYTDFILIYVLSNGIITAILWIHITRKKHFRIAAISKKLYLNRKEIIKYGLFAVLSGSSAAFIQSIGTLMLSATNQSMTFVGIYTTYFGIAIIISLPAKALNRTSYQLVSEAWKNNDLAKIQKIYYKTSVIQCLIGCLLLVGLISNKQNLIYLLHKPEYNYHFNVLIVTGLACLVDITGGLNGHIISTSKYYKLVTFLLVAAVALIAVLNLGLIPHYGLLGAALAYLTTIAALNITYYFFIKIKFGLNPFAQAHILIIAISILSLLIGLYLPKHPNHYMDCLIRSTTIGAVFTLMTYFFRVSEDINQVINKVLFRK